MCTQESGAATLESVYRPVLSAIARAALQLESLPLANDDFAVASARLRNAERYR
jgi:hypothetical protein